MPQLVRPPVYLSGAVPSPATVRIVQQKAGGALGIAAVAVLGAVAAYYVPKLLDLYAAPMLDERHGEPVELDVRD